MQFVFKLNVRQLNIVLDEQFTAIVLPFLGVANMYIRNAKVVDLSQL